MKVTYLKIYVVSILSLLLLVGFFAAHPASAASRQFTYQGKLTDNTGAPLTGSYSIDFQLYTVSTGGVSIWNETQTVSPTTGLFTVQLPSDATLIGNPLPAAASLTGDLYLGINVNGDGEMSPRKPLTVVASAITAEYLPGLTAADGDYFDFSAILHDDAALQGLVLPNIGATPTNPGSGEGFIGYDEVNDTIEYYDGTNWVAIGASTSLGPADQTLTANRSVFMSGFDLLLDGTVSDIQFTDQGVITAGGNINTSGDLTANGGDLNLGTDTNPGTLTLYAEQGATDYTVTLTTPATGMSANTTLVLPPDTGNANEVLRTDGSGNLTWADASNADAAGAATQIQYNTGGTFDAEADFVYDATNNVLTVGATDIFNVNTGATGSLYIGEGAGTTAAGAESNVALGALAGDGLTTQDSVVVIGAEAEALGFGDVVVGAEAASVAAGSGGLNVISGYLAGSDMTGVATQSVAVGALSGRTLANLANTFVGYSAGIANTGDHNVFVGHSAGGGTGAAGENTAVGSGAGSSLTSGTFNLLFGRDAGSNITDGIRNTVLGASAGGGITSGDDNVLIGHSANTTGSDVLSISNNTTADLIYGEFDNLLVRTNAQLQVNQDNNTTAFDIDSESTDQNVLVVNADPTTTGNVFDISADGLTTGSLFSASTTNAFTGDLFDIALSGNSSGNVFNVTSSGATATSPVLFVDLDNGDNDNDVIVIQSDEVTNSTSAADTNKFRVTASGEVHSNVGFSAGTATTQYYDGSIESTGAFTFNTTSDQAITLGAGLLTTEGNVQVDGGTITLGGDGQDGSLAIYSEQGATDYTLTLAPNAAMTQDVTWTLPVDDGAANSVLVSDGAGALTWGSGTSIGAAGADTQIQFNNSGVMGASADFVFDDTNDILTIDTTLDVFGTFLGSFGTISSVFLGEEAGNTAAGRSNVGIGDSAGTALTALADQNIIIGSGAGIAMTDADQNVIIGAAAGNTLTTGVGNVFLGRATGQSETGSNKLYIDNSNTTRPLIYGEFDNDLVEINGDLYIGDPVGSSPNELRFYEGANYVGFEAAGALTADQMWVLPTADGATNTVLRTDGSGALTWADATNVDAAGSTTEIQFNNGGVMGASSAFTYTDAAVDELVIGGTGAMRLYADTTNSNFYVGTESALGTIAGSNHTLFGLTAGANLAAGSAGNVFIGEDTGTESTTALLNTFVGISSGRDNETGSGNTYLGALAGRDGTAASSNTFVGYSAGVATTGSTNTFVGNFAGESATVGSSNVFLGNESGRSATGSSNVFLGNESGETETGSNKLIIENSNDIATPLIYGEFDNNRVAFNANVGIGTGVAAPSQTLQVTQAADGIVAEFTDDDNTCSVDPDVAVSCTSDERKKKNIETIASALEAVNDLRPVTYNWLNEDSSDPVVNGFIAQEIMEIYPDVVTVDSNGFYGVAYSKLTPYLTRAIQELDAKIEDFDTSDRNSWFQQMMSGVVNFGQLVGDLLQADRVETNELCIDDICIGADEFGEILEEAGIDVEDLQEEQEEEEEDNNTTGGGSNNDNNEGSDDEESDNDESANQDESENTEEDDQTTEDESNDENEEEETTENTEESASEEDPVDGEEATEDESSDESTDEESTEESQEDEPEESDPEKSSADDLGASEEETTEDEPEETEEAEEEPEEEEEVEEEPVEEEAEETTEV